LFCTHRRTSSDHSHVAMVAMAMVAVAMVAMVTNFPAHIDK
jgi:hypothetical protein